MINSLRIQSTTKKLFRRRFRLSRHLFLRILHTLQQHYDYFVQRRNAANTVGLSCEQKMTAALRMLAYGMSAGSLDKYVRIGETTTIKCVKRFCQGVVEIFRPEYLRSPNAADISRLLWKVNQRGFPGMLGSLDYMHWAWKNCPAAYHGMYTGHVHRPTIVLEAVASYDLWIWHVFFFFLACPDLTMILMYSTPPICLLTCEKDVTLQQIIP